MAKLPLQEPRPNDEDANASVKSKANPLGLSKNQLEKLGMDVCREIRASDSAITKLKQRWERLVKLFELDGAVTNLNLIPGLATYPYALSRQKLDEIRAQIHKSVTGFDPYVQVIPFVKEEETLAAAQRVVDALQSLATQDTGRLGFDRALRACLKILVNTGVAMMQVWVDPDEGTIKFDCIAPQDFCFYPHEFVDMKRAKTIGKKFWMSAGEVEAKIKSHHYLKCEIGGENNYDSKAGLSENALGTTQSSPTELDDDKIKFYQVVRRCRFASPNSDKEKASEVANAGDYEDEKDYLIVVKFEDQTVVRVEPLRYKTGRMWFDLRLEEDYGTFWPGNSPGNLLQGLQLATSDLLNILVHGAFADAFGEQHVIGESTPVKELRRGPGTTQYHTSSEVKVWQSTQNFNPGPIMLALQALDQKADQLSKVTPIGTTEAMKSDTSAHEAEAFYANKEAAKDEYTTYIMPTIAEIFTYMKELATAHWPLISRKQGDLGLKNHNDLKVKGRIVPTGKTSNPQTNMQKVQAAMQIATNPASTYSMEKLEDLMMLLLDLPVTPELLKKLGPSAHELTLVLQGLLLWISWFQQTGGQGEVPEGAVTPEQTSQIINEIVQGVAKLPSDRGLDSQGDPIPPPDETQPAPPIAQIGGGAMPEAEVA